MHNTVLYAVVHHILKVYNTFYTATSDLNAWLSKHAPCCLILFIEYAVILLHLDLLEAL